MRWRFAVLPIVMLATMASAQPVAPARIDGEVIALDGVTLTLRARGGGDNVVLALVDATRITLRTPGAVDQIVPGTYVAVTATPGADGMLAASEVRIFEGSLRGVGEGHRPMAGLPGNTMTNATVSRTRAAGTPGATVAQTAGGKPGETLVMTVTYRDGEQQISVPPGTLVERVEPATSALLVPGARVAAFASRAPDGRMVAERINVGRDGYPQGR